MWAKLKHSHASILTGGAPLQMVYDRLEKQHGAVLVERALSYIYTSREGLVWQELYDLLSCDDDVLDEVYKPVVPKFRRIPSFKAKLLSNDLNVLVEPRFNNQVPTYKFRYIIFRDSVWEKYGLENTVRQCSFHKAMACYFTGEWVDGKEILHLHTQQVATFSCLCIIRVSNVHYTFKCAPK